MKKYSHFFGRTIKSAKDYDAKNATLLIKAGYIDQEMSGVYSLLPLGYKVFKKIEQIIREEMDKVADEVFMPVLQPVASWEATKRFDKVDILLKAIGANEASRKQNPSEYVVGSTSEEIVTPLAMRYNKSYRDFPFAVYQFQNKFRNEARPKSGLLRGREFVMKDGYSFHASEDDLLKYYEAMKGVYTKIFERVGLGEKTVMALASGGDFTDEYSHEFQTITPVGEDTLFEDPESGVVYNKEVAPARAPKFDNASEEMREREDVLGEGLIGVEALAKFLNIEVERTTKTLIFEAEGGKRIIAIAVRGDYDVNEDKLADVIGTRNFTLASMETIKRLTGAEVGYAGLLNLPKEVEVYMDDSMEGRMNFEMGANQTNYHSVNVNFGRDLELPEKFYDFKLAKQGDLSPESGKEYIVHTAAEVGNIFPLNTKFSNAFGYTYTDKDGKQKPVYMGCYGIGLQRTMGVLAEVFSDEKGLVWPKQVAPFAVHFITLKGELEAEALDLIEKIEAAGLEVLWDDRENVSAGEKFSDAELIGIPVRVILSSRSMDAGGVEVTDRASGKSEVVAMTDLVDFLSK